MAIKPENINVFPEPPEFTPTGGFQPIYGKFDLTTFIQGASDYEIMAYLVGQYNKWISQYNVVTEWATTAIDACKQLQDWVNQWFDDLDVQQEINNKLDEYLKNGTLLNLVKTASDALAKEQIPTSVTNWLNKNVTPTGSTVVVDKSLSIEGAAADAKTTGDKLNSLNQDLTNVKNLEKTEEPFNWKRGTWNRGSAPNYTPTFINRNDRVAFAELIFLQKGSEISIEKYDGQKYAIARWTKNKDVWTNIEYSNWFTENQSRTLNRDEYINVVCAMEDDTSPITINDVHITVHLYKNYNLLNAIKNKTELKAYFVEELNDTIKKINALQTEPCLVFPLITDIHYDQRSSILQNFDDTISIIKKMSENVNFDFILNLGDNINGSSDKELVLSDARYMLNSFKNIGLPYLFILGNHDTNYDPSPKFTINETYSAFYSATPKTAKVNTSSNGTDFYIDYNELKIRIVLLNSNYLNSLFISDTSARWFKNDALNTDNVVIFCTHESPINTQNWAAKNIYNGEWVKEQISNFIGNGGTIIQLFGHSHADYNFSTPWLSIASNCSKFEQSNLDTAEYKAITGYDGSIDAPMRVRGTDTEQSFSVVVVRPTIKKINLVRFGAGADREFAY